MIDEKKLLCAFIYSAYESGYCGLLLNKKVREEHKKMYLDYIANEKYYPEKEIRETQEKMLDYASNSGVRDYLYRAHFDVVKKRVEEEAGLKLDDVAMSGDRLLQAAVRLCPVNLYEVVEVKDAEVIGRDMVLRKKMKLRILQGLERPNLGDIVSGHWGFMLEILEDPEEIIKYQDIARNYHYSFK